MFIYNIGVSWEWHRPPGLGWAVLCGGWGLVRGIKCLGPKWGGKMPWLNVLVWYIGRKGCILVASGIVLVLNWCKSRLQSYNMFFGFAIV